MAIASNQHDIVKGSITSNETRVNYSVSLTPRPCEHEPSAPVQDSLGGNAKTMIIANVLPTFAAAHETLSTLQFASRAKHIRNKAIVNEDTSGELAVVQRELHRLRRSA